MSGSLKHFFLCIYFRVYTFQWRINGFFFSDINSMCLYEHSIKCTKIKACDTSWKTRIIFLLRNKKICVWTKRLSVVYCHPFEPKIILPIPGFITVVSEKQMTTLNLVCMRLLEEYLWKIQRGQQECIRRAFRLIHTKEEEKGSRLG